MDKGERPHMTCNVHCWSGKHHGSCSFWIMFKLVEFMEGLNAVVKFCCRKSFILSHINLWFCHVATISRHFCLPSAVAICKSVQTPLQPRRWWQWRRNNLQTYQQPAVMANTNKQFHTFTSSRHKAALSSNWSIYSSLHSGLVSTNSRKTCLSL